MDDVPIWMTCEAATEGIKVVVSMGKVVASAACVGVGATLLLVTWTAVVLLSRPSTMEVLASSSETARITLLLRMVLLASRPGIHIVPLMEMVPFPEKVLLPVHVMLASGTRTVPFEMTGTMVTVSPPSSSPLTPGTTPTETWVATAEATALEAMPVGSGRPAVEMVVVGAVVGSGIHAVFGVSSTAGASSSPAVAVGVVTGTVPSTPGRVYVKSGVVVGRSDSMMASSVMVGGTVFSPVAGVASAGSSVMVDGACGIS